MGHNIAMPWRRIFHVVRPVKVYVLASIFADETSKRRRGHVRGVLETD